MADLDLGPYLLDKTLGKGVSGSVTKDGTTYSRGLPSNMMNDAHLRHPDDNPKASSLTNAVTHLQGQ